MERERRGREGRGEKRTGIGTSCTKSKVVSLLLVVGFPVGVALMRAVRGDAMVMAAVYLILLDGVS